jgi:DNA-binding NarL/FixJ family response regulator
MPLRIILADDHPVIVRGIQTILEEESEFQILAEFRNGHALLQSPLIHSADLLLLDLNMPKIDGLRVLSSLSNSGSTIKTIVISAYNSRKLVEECREHGASAYIVKTEQLSDLKEIIRQVMKGEKVFPDFAAPALAPENKFSYLDDFLAKYKLTKREVEIIKMICKGMTSGDIADNLSLSTFTIQTHRKNIFRKLLLDTSNQVSLYEFASKNGLI